MKRDQRSEADEIYSAMRMLAFALLTSCAGVLVLGAWLLYRLMR